MVRGNDVVRIGALHLDGGSTHIAPSARCKSTVGIRALFLVLAIAPTHAPNPEAVAAPTVDRLRGLRAAHQQWTGDSYWRSGLVAVAITVPLVITIMVVGAQVLESYGFSLFIGSPFALGMVSAVLFGFSRPQTLGKCLAVGFWAFLVAGIGILVVGFEGAICLLMAAPIAFILVELGAIVGYLIQLRPWLGTHSIWMSLGVLMVLPALMAAESVTAPEPELRAVRTEVVIDATPEAVWRHVISFPPLPEPHEWLFRCGVAYPQRAEINGAGVGAERHCIFSTGAFVEPIDAWDPPRLLHFQVVEQPEPMREWSPYSIHPPHLHGYLVSHHGQFLIENLPAGRTRLEGTTWYTNRMWPASYWHPWSDFIIHSIHRRVLVHIQSLAESG